MWKRAVAIAALIPFLAAVSLSRDAVSSDALSLVMAVARTNGALDLMSIDYSGSGFVYAFGQSFRPGNPYPKFYAKYSRVIDYEKGLSQEETIRTQFENPPHGGGGQPLYREARGLTVVGEHSAWSGGALALTPQGWAKAALNANSSIQAIKLRGQRLTVVYFTVQGKYKISGYVDENNLLERVETRVPDAVLGDMLVKTTFSDYRDFNGVKFPMRIGQEQGGFPVLDLTVSDVQPNADAKIQPPLSPPPVHVEAHKIRDGLWYLAGSPSPNSMAVEFKDYTVIVESSVTEERALANIAELKRLVPNKPIRYHINSHHHADHAAGLRAFVAEGSTIITQEMNKQFYEQSVLKNPHTLEPDRLSRNPKAAKFIWVKDKYVLTDGDRRLEIYWVPEAGHTANLLMSYMPNEKLLMITDIFNQFGEPRPNDPPAGFVSPYYAALGESLKRYNLEVEQIAPSHGNSVVPMAVLRKSLEGTVQGPIVSPDGRSIR